MLLQTDVNDQGLNDTVLFLRTSDGTFLVSGEDLDRWRLRRPDAVPLTYQGQRYYPINALAGASVRFDEGRQTLSISTKAESFQPTLESVRGRAEGKPIVPQPGGFFNYTLAATHGDSGNIRSGAFEAGFFSRYGVLTSTALAPDLSDRSTWLRLESTYTIDHPTDMTSLRLGDSVTKPGAWGQSVRFGGIQYGTNFATQPNFIRSPFLAAAGQAALPSIVDVYVNNALVAQRSVPPGPFSVSNIPAVTGSGEVRVVVRDLLGREQLISVPFYSSATLLRPGVSDYSYEVGVQRQNFAVSSDTYGGGIGAATWRKGFTDALTAEVRAEATADSRDAGASAAYRLGSFGVVNGTVAASTSNAGTGELYGYGLEHIAQRYSIAVQTVQTTEDFRQSGMLPGQLPRRRQTSANLGVLLGRVGSVTLAYVVQQYRDQPTVETGTLGYAIPIGRWAQFSLTGVKTLSPSSGYTVFAAFSLSLGQTTSASAGLERSYDKASGTTQNHRTVTLQKSLPLGEGYGYRVQARDDDWMGGASAQTGFGTYTFDVAKAQSQNTAYQATASGGIGTIGGYTFFSRQITDSFGVVRVADYPHVRVLQDNQEVARTGSTGYAVLPRMRPYDRNPVSIDQSDLPFDANIGALKLEATPYYRSGVLIDFPVTRVRAATLHIVLDDGTDLPSGALARFDGKDHEFPTALGGEAYLEGFEAQNQLIVTWKNQSCTIDVPYPRTTDPLPDLGRFTCHGVKP